MVCMVIDTSDQLCCILQNHLMIFNLLSISFAAYFVIDVIHSVNIIDSFPCWTDGRHFGFTVLLTVFLFCWTHVGCHTVCVHSTGLLWKSVVEVCENSKKYVGTLLKLTLDGRIFFSRLF